MEKHVIITGGAGFIGSHLAGLLLDEGGWKVTVVDNFTPNYPRATKEEGLAMHRANPAFSLVEADILEEGALASLFGQYAGADTTVVHLAALVGVRPSVLDPLAYHRVNVEGTLRMLELARAHRTGHFILASSSSVYGEHPAVPWKETAAGLRPISPYGVTKQAAEHFTRLYARLHGLRTTALRFFTVYGPRQRPDLAVHAFFRNISEGRPVRQFGDGTTRRDYTYVGDIVAGVRSAMDRPVAGEGGKGDFELFNIGNSRTVPLRELIAAIEREVGRKAVIEQLPEQAGDVQQTFADISKARERFGYMPRTTLEEGLRRFHAWHDQVCGHVTGSGKE